MFRAISSRASILVFGSGLAVIYAVAVAIVSRLGQMENPDAIAGALTLDLTLLVPLLYYLLLVRLRGWPVVTVLPVFVLSVLAAGWLIPDSRHRVLDLVSYAAALAELGLIAFIAYKALQLREAYRERAAAGLDVYESLRESATAILGSLAGGALAYEATLGYYAVVGWTRSSTVGPRSFTAYREVAYIPLMVTVMIALVVETVGVHFLLRLWSPVVAWVVTGISLYTLIWLIGDLHAVRLRPIEICDETLRLRLGLRWTASIPLTSIESVQDPGGEAPAGKQGYLKALLFGAPNRRMQLSEPVRAVGLYGLTRRVTTIDLHVDDPARFDATLDQVGH